MWAAQVNFCDFETACSYGLGSWFDEDNTGQACSGSESLLCMGGSCYVAFTETYGSEVWAQGYTCRYAHVGAQELMISVRNGTTVIGGLYLETDGDVTATLEGGTSDTSTETPYTTTTWHEFKIHVDCGQSAGSDTAKVWVDGDLYAEITDATCTTTPNRVYFEGTGSTLWDDVETDNSSDPGPSVGCGGASGAVERVYSPIMMD